MKRKNKIKRKILIASAVLAALIAVVVGGCAIYLSDYYHAADGSIVAFEPADGISSYELDNGNVVFEPNDARIGFIFYPGGKVEHNAYQQLMAELARQGILCVLVKMPFNLAVLDVDAADGIKESFPHIEEWYMGGHSLGGSMAASYLSDNIDEYEGLVLLGSYSTADISESGLKVLSVYGSEDKVMNREKYDECKKNLPSDFDEVVIDGGCHAYFGTYGAQDGDGIPTVSNEAQIYSTALNIMLMMYS